MGKDSDGYGAGKEEGRRRENETVDEVIHRLFAALPEEKQREIIRLLELAQAGRSVPASFPEKRSEEAP